MRHQLFLLSVILTTTLHSLSAQCDLELTMTVSNSTPAIFQNVDYVLTLHNNGPQAATGIVVKVPQSQLISANGLVFTGSSATTGSYDNINQTWNVATLAAGGTTTLTLTLFTMQTGLPPVYAQVAAASPADVDSHPNNGNQPTPAEDDEALVVINSTQPCDLNLSFVDVQCVPASPNGPPEDYFQYKILATTSDPDVQFIEISQNPNFIGKYIIEPGVPFAPPFSSGFYNQASIRVPYWARAANNPACVVSDTAAAPQGCGMPVSPDPCNYYFYFNDVFCHEGGYGFSIIAQNFGGVLNGSYSLYVNNVLQGAHYIFGQQYELGLFGPLILPAPGVGDTIRVVSNQNPSCSLESLLFPETYCNQPSSPYCFQRAVFPWHEWISRVQFGGIDQESGKSGASDFRVNAYPPGSSAGYAVVHAGQSESLSVTASFSFQAYAESVRVWLDKNHDNAFDDATEILFEGQIPVPLSGPNTSAALQAQVNIPADVLSGSTSMKIAMQRGNYATGCNAIPFGEVEYYSVNILDGLPSGAPCDAATLTVLGTSCYDPGTPEGPGDDYYFIRYRVDLPGQEGLTVQASGSWIDEQGNYLFPQQNIQPFYFQGVVGQDTVFGPIAINEFPKLYFRASVYDPLGSFSCYNIAPVTVTAPAPCSDGIVPASTPNCSASSSFPWEDWISHVQIGAYENASGKNYYSSFTTNAIPLSQGATVPIALTASFSYFTYDEYWRLWIDYNHDGIFQTPAEVAYEGIAQRPQDATPYQVLHGNIHIPASALPGPANARISMRRNAFGQPCGIQPNGEVEDYAVNISQNLQTDILQRNNTMLQAEQSEYTLSPNPAGSSVFVKMPTLISPVHLRLFNQMGGLEKEFAIAATGSEEESRMIELDLSGILNGVHFLKIETPDKKQVTKKLVVNR